MGVPLAPELRRLSMGVPLASLRSHPLAHRSIARAAAHRQRSHGGSARLALFSTAAAADPARGGVTFDFGGQTSLVTGGASGIGKAVVQALHAAGARVVAMDVNESALQQLQSELGSARCSTVVADLSSSGGVAAATAQALQLAGGAVDHLVSRSALSHCFPASLCLSLPLSASLCLSLPLVGTLSVSV